MAKKHFDLDETLTRRTLIAASGGGAVLAGLIGRLYQLQVLEADRFTQLAEDNSVRLDLQLPRRGRILDRFGVELATHRLAGRITIVREQARDMEAVLGELAKIIDLPPARQARIIRDARRQAAFLPTLVAQELSYEDFARATIHAVNLPGIRVEMAESRSYPRGRDFAHVLGYVAKPNADETALLIDKILKQDGVDPGAAYQAARGSAANYALRRAREFVSHPGFRTGRSGIERFADDSLRGRRGARRVVSNAAGRVIEERPSEDLAATAGSDVSITIDAELQRAAIERFGDESGACVVLDIETGDILALVSTPAFDPNDFVNGISQTDYDVLRGNDRAPLYHKAYDGLYPPGSTFKMVVAAAALEQGVVTPQSQVYCRERYRFANRTWHCWKKGGHGAVNMHSAIKGSCDVYFYELANLTGEKAIADMARRFGFSQRWELGMTGGRSGVTPDDPWKRAVLNEPWYGGETLNFGIGQGYLNASPLQLALMTARIAAEGRVIEPNLIGSGPRPDATEPAKRYQQGDTRNNPSLLDLDNSAFAELDPDIMRRMKAGMFGVTSEWGGTARSSGDLGLGGPRLAGKTGTAQVRRISEAERASGVIDNTDLERKLRDHALFVAYAPADDPKYAISVIVEHGGGGSRAAAPVARDILAAALSRDSRARPTWQRSAATSSDERSG